MLLSGQAVSAFVPSRKGPALFVSIDVKSQDVDTIWIKDLEEVKCCHTIKSLQIAEDRMPVGRSDDNSA